MARLQGCIILTYCAFLFVSLTIAQEGQFRRPVSNSDARISEIQNKLLTVQQNIALINSAILGGNNSTILQTRLSALENEFHNIRGQLDNQRREGQNENGRYDAAILQLTNLYNQLDNQMRLLQQSITSRMNEEAIRRTPQEIIEKIKSHQFTEADSKIIKMGTSSPMIKMIVHEIYANNIGNFALLNDYGKATRYAAISYSILNALWYEMKANGHMDVYKLMALYKTLSSEVVNQPSVNSDSKNIATGILKEVTTVIVKNAAEILKTAVRAENYEGNSEIKGLANSLYLFNDRISDDTMRKVIDDVYDVTPKDRLVRYMYDNDMIPQIVGALVHIFNKFKEKGHLNDPAIMMLARYIKLLRDMKNYEGSVSAEKKNKILYVIYFLPLSVYALYFREKVCIKNVRYNEYMYAANNDFKWNKDRRYVFTWGGQEIPSQGYWFAKHYEDFIVEFESEAHKNEYLYVPIFEPVGKYRNVLTWIPGGSLGNKSAWRIELHGDEVSLKNQHFQERLCVSQQLYNNDWRRYVYTNKEDPNSNDSECRWKILAC